MCHVATVTLSQLTLHWHLFTFTMGTTLNELRQLIKKILRESNWSSWHDERTMKYLAQKRAEENKPWEPETRIGTSTAKQRPREYQSYVTRMTKEEAENISSRAARSAEREFGNPDVIKYYIGSDGNVYVSDVNSDWFRWDDVQNLWHAVHVPNVVDEAYMHKIVEAWSNAAIMGKARARRLNPRVWNKKEMTRQFYAQPKAPVPPATGPDPAAPSSPQPPSATNKKKISFMDAVHTWSGAAEELAYDELNLKDAEDAQATCGWYVLDDGKWQVYDYDTDWTWEYDHRMGNGEWFVADTGNNP